MGKNEVKAPEQNSGKKIVFDISSASRKKLIKLIVLLVAVLVITNPGLIPFLPSGIKNTLVSALSGLFGNVTAISKVIAFSWVKLFQLIVMILAVMILYEICVAVLKAVKPQTGRGKTLKNLLLSVANYLFVIVGIFWGLSIAGVNVSTLFASVGVLALIIGFGAESLIADLVTGLFMIFENEYNVGDIIEIDGYRGEVTFIGIRTTSVTDAGGNIKIYNNSDMRDIINLSDKSSRAVCDFPIPYETKIEDAEKSLEKVLTDVQKKHPEVFQTAPKYLGVQELADSAVILRVVAEVKESDRFTAARLLNREIKSGMEDLGISCPYNQIVVRKGE